MLFLTDNFPPEVNAPATRTFEHCKYWVEKGIDVTVITCHPNFPQGKVYKGHTNSFYKKETIDGIKVIRVWSYISANSGFLKRVIDFVSYAAMAFWIGLFQKCDLIIATSPQFFTAISGRSLSLLKRRPWIMEVRDLWPESIKSVEAMTGDETIYKVLEKLELELYKSATKIVVVTDTFKEIISGRGISPSKIEIVKNGVLLDKFSPIEKDAELVNKLGLENKFVIGYLGTHGLAHALDFILESAAKCTNLRVHFLLIGDGAKKSALVELANKLKLTNVTLLPFQPKDQINRYISVLDVSLVNLKKSDTFKTVIPSKIFENAAMAKPILLGVEGESAKIITDYNCGITFEPENTNSFLKAVEFLANSPAEFKVYQEQCILLAKDFDRNRKAQDMLEILDLASSKQGLKG